jgi:uncharacterized protein YidB (DUF937 family)
MGLLDSVIGALSGVRGSGGRGDTLGAVLGLLADDGDGPGVARLAERFEDAGLSEVFASWVRCGANLPVDSDDLQRVLGADTMENVTEQLGLSSRLAADRLSQMLPYVLDRLTPDGALPEDGLGDRGELMGRLAGP